MRGKDWSPKRHVKTQKQATYSTSTMMLARAAVRLSGNGQGLVTSTLAMNSTQNRAISAYQPKARCSRRMSQMKKHRPPRTPETIRLSVNNVRLRHHRSSYCCNTVHCPPRRTGPRPGVCPATPTTRIHKVFSPGCSRASGITQ